MLLDTPPCLIPFPASSLPTGRILHNAAPLPSGCAKARPLWTKHAPMPSLWPAKLSFPCAPHCPPPVLDEATPFTSLEAEPPGPNAAHNPKQVIATVTESRTRSCPLRRNMVSLRLPPNQKPAHNSPAKSTRRKKTGLEIPPPCGFSLVSWASPLREAGAQEPSVIEALNLSSLS